MRNLQLISPRYTVTGIITTVTLLDSKFLPGNQVEIRAQGLDAQGNKVGGEAVFVGRASNPSNLRQSANSLAVAEFGRFTQAI